MVDDDGQPLFVSQVRQRSPHCHRHLLHKELVAATYLMRATRIGGMDDPASGQGYVLRHAKIRARRLTRVERGALA